ncbi:MAG: hypothetical protein RSC92_05470 [Clostridia bacterium]
MDSNLMTFLFIIVLVKGMFFLIFSLPNSEINISKISTFKKVYEIESDLLNIEIEVLDKNNNKISSLTEYNDITYIITQIGNTKVKHTNNKIKENSNKIKIINKGKQTEFVILITEKEIKINNNEKMKFNYKSDLYNKLNKYIQ